MPYELLIKSTFSAAHYLRSYKGQKENLHGHNWAVEARITADRLDDESMLVDFADARKALDAVLDRFDHSNINDLPAFEDKNPTAELIARHIFEQLEQRLKPFNARLSSITLYETPTCAVVYSKS